MSQVAGIIFTIKDAFCFLHVLVQDLLYFNKDVLKIFSVTGPPG